jgi:hypothetical protein
MKLYKVLVDGQSCHGGSMQWSLPTKAGRKWTPGEWMQVGGKLAMCSQGIHLTRKPENWLKVGCEIYHAEADPAPELWDGDKCCVSAARLLRPARKPAYWQRVEEFVGSLPKARYFQPDGQPEPAWRLFEADSWAAARAATWAAAGDAAKAAAWAAARAATWAAAGDAARAAAWAAARAATWAAAWDAAWAAARAAAWAAAGDAARDAAGDAELLGCTLVCDGLPLDQKHINHAKARWRVWEKGYALLCDVDGVLYVYAARTRGRG